MNIDKHYIVLILMEFNVKSHVTASMSHGKMHTACTIYRCDFFKIRIKSQMYVHKKFQSWLIPR